MDDLTNHSSSENVMTNDVVHAQSETTSSGTENKVKVADTRNSVPNSHSDIVHEKASDVNLLSEDWKNVIVSQFVNEVKKDQSLPGKSTDNPCLDPIINSEDNGESLSEPNLTSIEQSDCIITTEKSPFKSEEKRTKSKRKSNSGEFKEVNDCDTEHNDDIHSEDVELEKGDHSVQDNGKQSQIYEQAEFCNSLQLQSASSLNLSDERLPLDTISSRVRLRGARKRKLRHLSPEKKNMVNSKTNEDASNLVKVDGEEEKEEEEEEFESDEKEKKKISRRRGRGKSRRKAQVLDVKDTQKGKTMIKISEIKQEVEDNENQDENYEENAHMEIQVKKENNDDYVNDEDSKDPAFEPLDPTKKKTKKLRKCEIPGRYTCKLCQKVFGTQRRLTVHMRTHMTDKFKECKVCGKKIKFSGSMRSHMKVHSTERPYKCEYCFKDFLRQDTLKVHIRSHTKEKLHFCEYCGKGFADSSHFRRHQKIHLGVKPYKCQFCPMSFIQNWSLKLHLMTHDGGEKPFVCDTCGKAFTTRQYLQAHIRTHTGEKPFSCPECGKCFSEKSTMKRHLRTHGNQKDFICEVCGKGFPRNWNLKTHMKIHQDDKRHACSICGKAFIQKINMEKHMNTHSRKPKVQASVTTNISSKTTMFIEKLFTDVGEVHILMTD